MKRLWIGIGIMAAMLLSGILTPAILEKSHTPVVEDLSRAAELAEAENWEGASRFCRRAEEQWKKTRPVTASFTDHEPMEEIDALFEQLKVYTRAGDRVAYCSTCAYLKSQLEALGDYHDLTLWNLF